MDFLFGADMPLAVRFFFAFVIVLALIGGTAFLVRRFGGERLGASSSRGRQPRLAVIDAAAVDGRRRLILIRRDNVEHLLMIGGPSDVVVEANIVRAAQQGARDAGGRAAAQPEALPRAVAMSESNNMWPLQPEPVPAPAPPPRAARQQPVAMEDPPPWQNEPEAPPLPPLQPRRAEVRPEPRAEMRSEMRPEPRVDMRMEARPEMRSEPRPEVRPEPRPEIRPEPRPADPLAGLAAELSRVNPDAPAGKPPSRPPREAARARAPQPERVRPVAPPPSMDEAQTSSNADQNLAEMAQRLEAALRRPKAPESRATESAPKPVLMAPVPQEPMLSEPMAIPTAEPAAANDSGPAAPQPARAAAQRPQKSVYDSLEQEMASLLGRPNSKA